jgi:hypothetical protein
LVDISSNYSIFLISFSLLFSIAHCLDALKLAKKEREREEKEREKNEALLALLGAPDRDKDSKVSVHHYKTNDGRIERTHLNPEIRANEKDGSKVPTRRSQQEV